MLVSRAFCYLEHEGRGRIVAVLSPAFFHHETPLDDRWSKNHLQNPVR